MSRTRTYGLLNVIRGKNQRILRLPNAISFTEVRNWLDLMSVRSTEDRETYTYFITVMDEVYVEHMIAKQDGNT